MYGTISPDRLDKAVQICAKFFNENGLGFCLKDLQGSGRRAEVVAKRAIVVKRLHGEFMANEISGILNRDHSTILYLLRSYDKKKLNNQFRNTVTGLSHKVNRSRIIAEIAIHKNRIKELKTLLNK